MEKETSATEEFVFKDEIKQLTTNDPGHADTFNPLFNQLLENTKFNKREIEDLGSDTGEDLEELHEKIGDLEEKITNDIQEIEFPVTRVNKRTGDVTLTASDVGAASDDHGHVYGDIKDVPKEFSPSAHKHSPDQVGLGNVQNYGIATEAQAQAGTVNNVYMTPLTTKEAVTKQVGDVINKIYRVSNTLLHDTGNIVGSYDAVKPYQVIGQFVPKYDGVLKLVFSNGNVSPAPTNSSVYSYNFVVNTSDMGGVGGSSYFNRSVNPAISNAIFAKNTRVSAIDLVGARAPRFDDMNSGAHKITLGGASFGFNSSDYNRVQEDHFYVSVKKGSVLTFLADIIKNYQAYKFNTMNVKIYGSVVDI